jgi:hypothetical protein
MPKKARLNLTVIPDFKRKANKLARERRRSVSALFEDLIEEEWKRAGKPGPGKKSPKKTPVPEPIGFHARRKNLISGMKNGHSNGKPQG